MMTTTTKYIISAFLLASAAISAAAGNFAAICGEKDGIVWTIDSAVSGRFVGTGIVLNLGADIAAYDAPSGIESVIADSEVKISIYPNPVVDVLRVDGIDENARWAMYLLDGRLAATGDMHNNVIDCSVIPAGRYILTLTGANGEKIHSSIIIKK